MIGNFCLSVAARNMDSADLFLGYDSPDTGTRSKQGKKTKQKQSITPFLITSPPPPHPLNTFLTRYIYLTYLPGIKKFSLPLTASLAEWLRLPASRAEDPGFESRLRRDFSGSSHTSNLKIGTPKATLPGAWRYRVSTGTGRPGVSIL